MEYANELERGELELLRAKILLSIGQRTEAEGSLFEAENLFRKLNDADKLSNVLITKSQLYLCHSHVSLALNDAKEALSISEGIASPSKYGQMHFNRGLAFLAMGKELEAHHDFNEYVSIAESLNDNHGQVLGHFYHALAYERHREPCMASAELEVAKEVVYVGDYSLKGRLNAFIAHLWLRRGILGETETLLSEATELINADVERVGPANMGMAFLVRAELLAMTSRWKESEEVFDQSIHILRNSRYGLYFEALALALYGETLIAAALKEQGCEKLFGAREIYLGMSNESQVGKIDAIIDGCNCTNKTAAES